jgi:multidrug resistance efflux pump
MRPSPVHLSLALAAAAAACDRALQGPSALHGVVEIQEVLVGSKVGGRVAETPAAEGALLKAGDVIARFEVPELEARRAQAEARVKAGEADLEKARNGPRTEEKGAARAAVETALARLALLKAGSRPEQVAAASAALETAAADLKFAEEDFARNEKLIMEKTISRTEWDASRALRDGVRGRHAAAKAALDLLLAGSRKEDIDAAEAEVRRSEAGEALLLAGTRAEEVAAADARVRELRAALAEIDAGLAEAVVHAPEDAVLEVLAVRKGDLLPPGAPVARLHRAADLWVKAFVPETELGNVRLGQEAEVTVDTFPGRKFAGKVSWIASQAEFTPRNVQSADERRHQVFAVKIVVADAGGAFKSGMAADVVLGAPPPSTR